MYDIVLMITHTPDKLLGHDFATISFRMSHWNNDFITYFTSIRLFCLLVTGTVIVFFFISSCNSQGIAMQAFNDFNFEQVCVLILLFLCAFFNDPFFELRRFSPSVTLAVLAEIPTFLFFTAILMFQITGLVYMRIRSKVLKQMNRKVRLRDITGFVNIKRASLILLALVGSVIVQTLLHFAYLTTETNRAIFSSFRHFKTSEDVREDPGTVILIVLNLLFGVAYIVIFLVEVTRSCIDFNRLKFS